MSESVVRIAVVGHTNTGKTSLLRTLTRNVDFGDISARPGTTRYVEGTVLLIGGKARIELYDTPGMEDSVTLLSLLGDSDGSGEDIDRVRAFLDSAAAYGDLEQEAKVLRQTSASDILLYVIDAREPMLGRHRDELTILGYCARPLVPVLNFTAGGDSRETEWRAHLARIGLHAVVAFDTVLFDRQDERRLFEAMQALLASQYQLFETLIAEREASWDAIRHATTAALADVLIDAAAATVRLRANDSEALRAQGEILRNRVREREEVHVRHVLEVFAFRGSDLVALDLPIRDGRWQMDLFAPEALRDFGLTAGGGAMKGAAIGLGIDVFTGGLSLGMAATLGATLGALWTTFDRFGRRMLDRLRQRVELRINDNTLRILAARELDLIRVLMRRGHASLATIEVQQTDTLVPWQGRPLPLVLRRARYRCDWSTLNGGTQRDVADDPDRRAALHGLQTELLRHLERS
ncbi:MAG: GTPase/DUF3482 domain-containing protein [Chromatiales bacterium]